MSEDSSVKLTPIDQIANSGNLQMMKALLPYMARSGQHQMAILIKAMEINNVLSFYQHPSDVSASSLDTKHISTMDMLQDIRSYLNGPEQSMIDQCLNMFQMMNLYNSFQNTGGSTDDMLKNLLSPEQQAMFETYQSMF